MSENDEKNKQNIDEEGKVSNIGDNVTLKSEKVKGFDEAISFDTTPIEIKKNKNLSISNIFRTKYLNKILIAVAVAAIIYILYKILS